MIEIAVEYYSGRATTKKIVRDVFLLGWKNGIL